ncbi:unnamed protein product [Dracunculus medinensis]|uniref:FHA domain-containing protein n=1 Tax=Dracunculus medinensis TaxID=318479 RepID=A0A0N4UJ22_DRAME|nr:unnamed protein product [Dracunculus medinensis]
MITIPNCGGQNITEFYASSRRSSLYKTLRVRSQSISYTRDGRVLINGELLRKSIPNEKWGELIRGSIKFTVFEQYRLTSSLSEGNLHQAKYLVAGSFGQTELVESRLEKNIGRNSADQSGDKVADAQPKKQKKNAKVNEKNFSEQNRHENQTLH